MKSGVRVQLYTILNYISCVIFTRVVSQYECVYLCTLFNYSSHYFKVCPFSNPLFSLAKINTVMLCSKFVLIMPHIPIYKYVLICELSTCMITSAYCLGTSLCNQFNDVIPAKDYEMTPCADVISIIYVAFV